MQMPKTWDINRSHQPFIGQSSVVKGSNNYTTGAGVGGPVLNTRYYQDLRWSLRDLEQYLARNAGNVTIGELEMVDDEGSGAAESDP